jgi:tetratricopeptide (TPR) repeat protein
LELGDEEKAKLAAGSDWDTMGYHRLRHQEFQVVSDALEVAKDDPYLMATLRVLQGENMVLLGRNGAVPLLREAVVLIEGVKPKDDKQIRRKEHILGLAHNNVAYFYWSVKDYGHAVQEYMLALPHLRRSDNLSAYAHTLKNLAYIYALQGRLTAAEILCRDALDNFRNLEDHNGEALSLNTLGLINVEGQQHETARVRCEKALRIFESLKDQRGIGLACTALGYSLRRLASRDTYSSKETITFFQDAEQYLKRAVSIFTSSISEPLRLVDAYKEFGCTYRDWSKFQRQRGDSSSESERSEVLALDNLQKSHDLASQIGMLVERADTLEDMAQVYFNRRDHERASQLLDQSDTLIPQQYFIQDTSGLPTISEPVAPFWAVLGKTSLLRGHLAFDQALKNESARWYTLASAYFGLYAEATTLTDYAAHSVYARVRSLPPDEIADWRRVTTLYEKEFCVGKTKLIEVLDETLGQI